MSRITGYLKPTNRCTVGCEHCYLPVHAREDRREMGFDTLRQAAEVLGKMAGSPSNVHVLWHGGEPMVLDADFYWKAGEILDEVLPGHTESMQSSLIPYRAGFGDLIKRRFGGMIGSSIDFSSRKVSGSVDRYQDVWLRKVCQARTDDIVVVPGVVPSRSELGKASAILGFMVRHGFTRFNLDRYNDFGGGCNDKSRPSHREHATFLTEMFDALMAQELHKRVVVRVIESAIRGVLYGLPGDRWGTRCQSSNLVIEPDGQVNNCPDKSFFEPSFGSVANGVSSIENSPARRKWIRLQAVGRASAASCHECGYSSWCRGGCPISGEIVDDSGECSGYKGFLDHIEKFAKDNRSVVESYLGN